MLESMLKEIDPIVSDVLSQSLDSKNISTKQAVELFDTKGTEMIMTAMVADLLRRRSVGDKVTYVINRNINFTNVCIKRCGSCRSGLSVREYLSMLKESGLGSLPGTAAEILDQDLRDLISPGRISVADWINVITSAHKLKIPTTSTIMYGHIETSENKAKHL